MARYEAQCSTVGSFGYANYFKLYVDLTEVEVNVGNNTSKIQYHVYCQSSGSGSINANHFKYFNINGQTITNITERVNVSSPNAYILIASGTTAEILHNADGSKTVPFSAEIRGSTYGVSASISNNFTLSTIPRASKPTFSGTLEVGQTITIHTNRASTNFTHQLFYSLDGSSWTFLAIGVGDSYAWNVPVEFANNIPNSASATVIISCETFNGDNYIGETRTSFTISIPDTSTFQPYLFDIILSEAVDGIDEQFGTYIQNQSKLNCEVDCFGSFSSTIISCKVVINGVTYNEKTFTTDVLRLAGTNNAVATVTDSRGRKATLTVEFEVAEYQSPTITQFIVNRCNEDGSSNEEGEYAKIEVSAIVKRLNDKNPYTYNLQYKKGEEQQYNTYDIELTEVKTDTDITIGGSIVIPASGDYSFDYLFVVSDYFTDNTNKPSDIGTAFQLFNWKENGRGFALGKVSEKDAFEVNMDIYDKYGQLITGSTVLYEDATGTNGNVTLSETSANFSYIEVYFQRQNAYELSVRISNPNGKQAKLQEVGSTYIHFSVIAFLEDVIETGGYSRSVQISDGANTSYDTNIFNITKVVGYR